MSKTAFIFPGQGSQYVGMGKEFYENLPICREVYDLASEVTGLDLPKLCFMENEQIHQTEYTQICMLATEVAIYMALEQNGYQPDVTAGLSLGEYGALVASGVMTAEEAFQSLAPKMGRPNDKEIKAKEFLLEMLKDGEMLSSDCEERLEAAGFKKSTIKKAKKNAGVISKKKGFLWYWSLPMSDIPRE